MMKLFDKIYNWFFDRETDKEEGWEVPFKKGDDITNRYHKFMMEVNEDNLNHSRKTNKFNRVIDDFESFEMQDCKVKIKYYKRKVKVFHGLQGFKWEHSHKIGTNLDFKNFDNIMKLLGYIEITKEEYEANVK